MGVGLWAQASGGRAGITRVGPVLCCFGVSKFESSRGRGEKFFPFFFWPRLIFFSRKNWFFSSNLIALLVVAMWIERRY